MSLDKTPSSHELIAAAVTFMDRYKELSTALAEFERRTSLEPGAWAVNPFSPSIRPGKESLSMLMDGVSNIYYKDNQAANETIKYPGVLGVSGDLIEWVDSTLNPAKSRLKSAYTALNKFNASKGRMAPWLCKKLESSARKSLARNIGETIGRLSIKQACRQIQTSKESPKLISWYWEKEHKSYTRLDKGKLIKDIIKDEESGLITKNYAEHCIRAIAPQGGELTKVQSAKKPTLYITQKFSSATGCVRGKSLAALPLLIPKQVFPAFKFHDVDAQSARKSRPSKNRVPLLEGRRVYLTV